MYDRILVPTDGSTGSAHVAMQAVDLADQYDADVHVVHVLDTTMRSILAEAGTEDDTLRRHGERAVDTVAQIAESNDVWATTTVIEGDPAERILDEADEVGADIIVAGTHGRSGVKRQLLGSVAERLVRHAPCPVMTVRLPETDVTVDDSETVRELIGDALEEEGYDATVQDIERQLKVWVGRADTGTESVVVYLDPITQRTSVLPQGS